METPVLNTNWVSEHSLCKPNPCCWWWWLMH